MSHGNESKLFKQTATIVVCCPWLGVVHSTLPDQADALNSITRSIWEETNLISEKKEL